MFCNTLFAQIKNDTLLIVKDYVPIVADAVKKSFTPVLPVNDSTPVTLSYDAPTRLLNLPFVPADLKAISMVKDPSENYQNNIIKIGSGFPASFFFETHVNTGASKKGIGGIDVNYFQFNGKELMDMNSYNSTAWGKLYSKKNSISAYAGLDGGTRFYYETIDPLIAIDKQKAKIPAVGFNFGAALSNLKYGTDKFNYNIFADGNYFVRAPKNIDTAQSEIFINSGLKFLFGNTSGNSFSMNLFFANDQYTFSKTENNFRINFNPAYNVTAAAGSAHIGAALIAHQNELIIYPDVYGSYNLIDDVLSLVGGVEFKEENNTLKNLTATNPFLSATTKPNLSESINMYVGFKTNPGNNVSLILNGGEIFYSHFVSFIPDSTNPITYSTEIDTNVHAMHIHAEGLYKQSEKINFSAAADYYHFNFSEFGMPAFKLYGQVSYNIQKKILLRSQLVAYSSSQTVDPFSHSTETIKGRLDLSVDATYNYKSNFGLYVQLNNLAASTYQRWYAYKGYGFNFNAGLLLKF